MQNNFLFNLIRFDILFTISAFIWAAVTPVLAKSHPAAAAITLMILIPFVIGPLSSVIAALFYYLKINRYALTSIIEPIVLGPLMTLVFLIGGSSDPDALMPDSKFFTTIYSYFDFGWPYFNVIVAILLVQGGIIHLYHFLRKKLTKPNDQTSESPSVSNREKEEIQKNVMREMTLRFFCRFLLVSTALYFVYLTFISFGNGSSDIFNLLFMLPFLLFGFSILALIYTLYAWALRKTKLDKNMLRAKYSNIFIWVIALSISVSAVKFIYDSDLAPIYGLLAPICLSAIFYTTRYAFIRKRRSKSNDQAANTNI